MLVAMPAITTWLTFTDRKYSSRTVPWNALQLFLVTNWSPSDTWSCGTRSVQFGLGFDVDLGSSVRPGAPPATVISTTGSPFARNALARLAARSTTSVAGGKGGTRRRPSPRPNNENA